MSGVRRLLAVVIPVGLVVWHWRLWQRDRALPARQLPEPLPSLDGWPVLPPVSVLVAAWNESAGIEDHIASFLALRYPNKELVLCAGGDDCTYELACRHAGPQVRVLRQAPGEGKQRALERSFAEAKGEIVFLTDADCLLADEPFERTLRPVVLGPAKASTGLSRPLRRQVNDAFVQLQWSTSYYVDAHNPGDLSAGILGRNAAVERETLRLAWLAGERVPTGTDYYLALRVREMGHSVRRVPASVIETRFPHDLDDYIRRQRRWLRNLVVWGGRFDDRDQIRAAAISMATGFVMLGLPLLIPMFGAAAVVFCLLLWAHVLMARLRYLRFLQEREGLAGSRLPLAAILSIAVADFRSWAGAAVELLSRKGKGRW
jgi:glycosyltransferase involved in cell wall biosynthesis